MKRAHHPVLRHYRKLPLAVAVASFATVPSLLVPCALAQQGEVRSQVFEEIVVTARKTEESAQDVPISIKALSGTDLRKQAVLTVSDLRFSIPGLFVAHNNQGGAPTFAIRAAKADNGTSDTVTAYIGDVPVASTRSIANMMYDLQSVQVLKGPQGTLFGANSTGGAIIFRPSMPTDTFEGHAEVGLGDYERQEYEAMVNVPINDMVQLRVAGRMVRRDEGYDKNQAPAAGQFAPVGGNGESDFNDEKKDSARFTLRVKPTEALQNDLEFDYFHEDDQPLGDTIVFLRRRFDYRTFLGFSLPVDYESNGITVPRDREHLSVNGLPTWNKADIYNVFDTLSYSVSDTTAFKLVLGYQDLDLDTSQIGNGSTVVSITGRTRHQTEMWTVEPSLDTEWMEGRLRNKTGLFYSRQEIETGNSYYVLGLPWDRSNPLVGTADRFYPLASNNLYFRRFESQAIYSQFSYDLSDELTATLGGRYTWDTGDYSTQPRRAFPSAGLLPGETPPSQDFVEHYGDFGSGNCAPDGLIPIGGDPVACKGFNDQESSSPSFSFTLEDRFTDAAMVYAAIRHGYLRGGFNNNQNPAVTGIDTTFKPEKVVDFETGIKADWEVFGRPIRTNVALFYGTYDDQQRVQNGTTATGTTFVGVVNAGSSNFYGFDFDGTLALNDVFDVTLTWNHVESEYTNFDAIVNIPGVFAFIDKQGDPMSQTPEDVVNIGFNANWSLPAEMGTLASTLTWFFTSGTDARDSPTFNGPRLASGELTGEAFPGQDFRAWDRLPSYELWNFTTTWNQVMGSNFDASIWVRNLADEEYAVYSSNQTLAYGHMTYNFGDPRTWGVNVRYNF